MKGLCLSFILAFILAIGIICGTVQAQPLPPDVSMWDATFWQIKSVSKGYYFSPNAVTNNGPPDTKIKASSTQWGILSIDPLGFLNMDVYAPDASGACALVETLNLSYLAGSGIDFLADFVINSEGGFTTGLLNINGTLDSKGVVILKGKLASLGAHNEETDFQTSGDIAAFGITLKGKLVKTLGCTI